VAELEFNTFPAPAQVTYFDVNLPWNSQTAAAGLKNVQDFGKTMPAEITMQVFMSKNGYSLDGAYVGDEASLRNAIKPLLTKLGAQLADARALAWLDLVAHFAGSGDINPTSAAYNAVSICTPSSSCHILMQSQHDTFYASSIMTPALTSDQFNSFVNYISTTGASTSHNWWMQMDLHGGQNSAVSKPKTTDTAYVHRDKLLLFQLYDSVPQGQQYPSDGFSLMKGFRRSISKSIPDGQWGMYANYPDSQLSQADANSLYWGANRARLASIKTIYDSKNLFRSPQSVKGA
jgi:hypothetical protein